MNGGTGSIRAGCMYIYVCACYSEKRFIYLKSIAIQYNAIESRYGLTEGGIEPTHAPLLTACESVSSTSTPAPSLMTKPPRFRSKGLDAEVGRSLQAVFIAIKLQKPAKLSGVSGASVPP